MPHSSQSKWKPPEDTPSASAIKCVPILSVPSVKIAEEPIRLWDASCSMHFRNSTLLSLPGHPFISILLCSNMTYIFSPLTTQLFPAIAFSFSSQLDSRKSSITYATSIFLPHIMWFPPVWSHHSYLSYPGWGHLWLVTSILLKS